MKEWFYDKHVDYDIIPEGILLDAIVNSVDWESDTIYELLWNLRWEAERNLKEEEEKEEKKTENMTGAEYIQHMKQKQQEDWVKQFG